MQINGSCHCGNIRFALTWKPDPEKIVARACTCSFCMKHGNVWTSKPDGTLTVTVRDPSHTSNYKFGTATADFLICAACGIVPLATSMIDGQTYAVVNVNTFENVPMPNIERISSTLDDETEVTRLARRKQNWIADVRMPVC